MAWAANFDDFDQSMICAISDDGRGRSNNNHYGQNFQDDHQECPVTNIANLFPGAPSVVTKFFFCYFRPTVKAFLSI